MTLWAKRTDGNHAEIRDAMRKAGAEVEDLSGSGRGMPDTLVFTPDGRLLLVEIKMPKGTLTPPQVKFHARFPVHIVRSVEDALQLIRNTLVHPPRVGCDSSSDPDHDSHDETTYNETP